MQLHRPHAFRHLQAMHMAYVTTPGTENARGREHQSILRSPRTAWLCLRRQLLPQALQSNRRRPVSPRLLDSISHGLAGALVAAGCEEHQGEAFAPEGLDLVAAVAIEDARAGLPEVQQDAGLAAELLQIAMLAVAWPVAQPTACEGTDRQRHGRALVGPVSVEPGRVVLVDGDRCVGQALRPEAGWQSATHPTNKQAVEVLVTAARLRDLELACTVLPDHAQRVAVDPRLPIWKYVLATGVLVKTPQAQSRQRHRVHRPTTWWQRRQSILRECVRGPSFLVDAIYRGDVVDALALAYSGPTFERLIERLVHERTHRFLLAWLLYLRKISPRVEVRLRRAGLCHSSLHRAHELLPSGDLTRKHHFPEPGSH
mmetsp:Transcript_109470/g.244285  ORF Transcript_109470/g.244285 Transcript_109470/m.244285 type:complete len:371 (+) Transcript_109470:54-1166(+)